jgi:hypothetical protein
VAMFPASASFRGEGPLANLLRRGATRVDGRQRPLDYDGVDPDGRNPRRRLAKCGWSGSFRTPRRTSLLGGLQSSQRARYFLLPISKLHANSRPIYVLYQRPRRQERVPAAPRVARAGTRVCGAEFL